MNYYPHHIGDYSAATAHLTWVEDMAYTRLIRMYYQSEKPIPLDMRQVYRLVRASTDVEREAIDTVLAEFFTQESDGFHQKRCDVEIERMQCKSSKARESAAKRWQSDGNANAMRTHVETDANACETVCVGNAPNNQEPIANNQEPKKEKTKAQPQAAFVCPDWVPSEAWDGWVAMRKAKRTPNSLHALELAVKTLDGLRQSGFDPKDVLDQSTVRGWTGLFEVKKHTDANSMKPRFAPERDFKTIDYRAGVKPDGRF